jgi:type IV pilus assembly protein PilA
MNRLRLKSESGFTLIELLVVVAIIGILAAIAIPQFSAYRKRGYEAAVKSDLRNGAVAEEAYFAGKGLYVGGGPLNNTFVSGFNPTQTVTTTAVAGANTFVLMATHISCSGVNWTFNSATGTITGPGGGCP